MSDTTTHPAPTATRATARRDRSVLHGTFVLAALSVGGALIAVATGLSADVGEAMGPTGRLSIPIPMMLAQLAVAWLASGTRRRPAIVASALLVLVEPVCILSGFADGGYSDPARTPLHIGYQLLFVAAIGVVGLLAARRLVLLLRRRA